MRTAPAGVLWLALLWPFASYALPPPVPWDGEEGLSFRLLLGSLDGNENSRLLHNDGRRYTAGLSVSSPVGPDDRLQANLEIWVNERGYPAAATAAGTPTDSVTYQAVALTYGLRAQTRTAVRPYALATIGFQANRVETRTLTTPAANVTEETLVPAAQVGLGIEWQVGSELFSLDWRHWFAKGDFSDFGARGLDLGGDFIGLGLGRRW